MIRERRVELEVDGDAIVGILRSPEGGGSRIGLVFDGPLTSVKEQVTGNYAAAMADRGFVTLAIDHRHFGESDGAPRFLEDPNKKVQDTRVCVDFLGQMSEVARVGAVGICAGAGYMSRAVANDDRIAAWGTVAGFFHDAAQQKVWMGDGYEAAIDKARAARDKFEKTGVSDEIPAVGDGEVAMPMAEACDYYGTERGAVPNYTNSFAMMSREHTLVWDAMSAAPEIDVPTLMIHSEKALAPALARKFFQALGGPKQEIWVASIGQIDFYDRPERIDPAADALADHFREHLG